MPGMASHALDAVGRDGASTPCAQRLPDDLLHEVLDEILCACDAWDILVLEALVNHLPD